MTARPFHLAADDENADATLCCGRRFLELLPRGDRLTTRPSDVTCGSYQRPPGTYETAAAGTVPGSYADLIASLRPVINNDLLALLAVDAWCDRADAATRRTRP